MKNLHGEKSLSAFFDPFAKVSAFEILMFEEDLMNKLTKLDSTDICNLIKKAGFLRILHT